MTDAAIERVEKLARLCEDHNGGIIRIRTDDLRALLERVKALEAALENADRRLSRPDWTVQRDTVRAAIRAALNTGEPKPPLTANFHTFTPSTGEG